MVHLLNSYFECLFLCFVPVASCFDWVVLLPPSCGRRLSSLGHAGSRSESVTLFGLRFISFGVEVLICTPHPHVAVYVLDWWTCYGKSTCPVCGQGAPFSSK